MLLIFFAMIIYVLQRSHVKDKNFTDYAVGGRSFGANYQAMSFLNTWYPGAMFTAFAGLAAGAGVISFYVLAYSLLTVVLMYAMAKTVWVWGKKFDLHTQPDLFALRYDSRHIRTIAALIGIVSGFPWLVLAMQAMGGLFHFMSLGALPFSEAVILGVIVVAIRQIWTIRMGMRGVIISDMYQGIVAYVFGSVMLCALIAWLCFSKGITLGSLDPKMFALPGIGSKEGPLYLFSLLFTGTIGGWCLPFIFVRLFTAEGVVALKKSAALAMPLSLIFGVSLLIFGMLASQLPGIAGHEEDVWFLVSQQAGGLVLLGLAGVVLLAASIGHTDGSIQATGAQFANDLIGNYVDLTPRQLVTVSKLAMVVLTALAAWVACLSLPALFTLAVLAYQGVIQLAVPQFLGIFWKRGNKQGAIAGMVVGFVLVIMLELFFKETLAGAYGLSSGVLALVVNLAVYVGFAYFKPHTAQESERVETLFAVARDAQPEAIPMPIADLPVRG
ncbi:sodium:solute symporter family protein [Pseudomonas sp. RC10]|uniref:sodium:solute symporter family protein n=1 Tax=Pseudomonas bambusae TaxID=3139142 RepID=UPI00313920D3